MKAIFTIMILGAFIVAGQAFSFHQDSEGNLNPKTAYALEDGWDEGYDEYFEFDDDYSFYGDEELKPCPEKTGGYKASGKRSKLTDTQWVILFNVDGAFDFTVFPSKDAGLAKVGVAYGGKGEVRQLKFVGYECDQTNDKVCWVCNMYPLFDADVD